MGCLLWARACCALVPDWQQREATSKSSGVQKLLLLRKDTATREAQLREEAAAARGEAEAAAQLVHALEPKGDFVLGTLWTKVTPKLSRLGTFCSCHGL